ncbi:MFS transporter [Rhizobium sp. NZLR3b]|uniref:MFS transporter n=1 Tax=Rhizobium sp. NZLR3b TaxID=2731101 RepID=UPI001C82F8CF|nr:MFS transporter [Rhizobium sp. NZLR3b]MBX5193493.1 MFS transporter [Rhizobium sp. NZLR3b]
MLDGFDASLYAYVLVSSLAELLPASGIAANEANIGLYGGMLFSVFMVGWAASIFWGWAADRYGRVSILCWTVLFYSVFTAASGLATGIASFAMFRFLTGFGIGGEWGAGTPLLQEGVPEQKRVLLAGWLHTAIPVGFLLAALVVMMAGDMLGWRGVFLVGILPALLILYVRLAFSVPMRRETASRTSKPFAELFRTTRAQATWSSALMLSCAVFGLWSSNFWAPTIVMIKLTAAGATPKHALQMEALAGIATNLGTFVACLLMPWITTGLGSRRKTAVLFFLGSIASTIACYELAIEYLHNIALFFCLLPLLGFFTNGIFSLFTIWLPELFPTALRGSGSSFAFSSGRLLGAAGPSIVGLLATATGLPHAISILAGIYLIGLPFIVISPETAGRPLPA